MVIGQYQSKLTQNGRISLPKKFRDELGSHYVVTKGYEGSLLIVPFENWEKVVQETTNKPFLLGEARDTTRYLLGNASSIETDEQGRFVIPNYLKTYAGIKNEVVCLGLGKYIELWSLELWTSYQEKLTGKIGQIAQKLSELPKRSE